MEVQKFMSAANEGGASAHFDVLIVGAGHAGTHVATELLAEGFTGSIGLLSAESRFPYQRPPLTKGFLQGKLDANELLLRPESFWADSGVTLILGEEASTVDPSAHIASTMNGSTYSYGSLVWAAGGSARRLGRPGEEFDGVHALRTLDDAEYAKSSITPGKRYVIIGGGFIGLEAAAAFVSAGMNVTVLEAQERLLARVTGPDVSEFFLRVHQDVGVRIERNAEVIALGGQNDQVSEVILRSGEVLPADVVLVGIGLVPNVNPLLDAGAVCGNGVEVDAYGATSLPDVYAVGDCASFPFEQSPLSRLRLESIQNATEQAKAVVTSLLGDPKAYSPEPWFWSNQYHVKFKTVGIATGYDQSIVRGDPTEGRFSVVYLRAGRVLAVDSINMMRDYVGARAIVGHIVSLDAISDPTVKLADALIAGRE